MGLPKSINQDDQITNVDSWFNSQISTLRFHHAQIKNGNAPIEMKQAYDEIIEADDDFKQIFIMQNKYATKHFIVEMLNNYVESGIVEHESIVKLAFGLDESKLIVWAEIQDDNEEIEYMLFDLAGNINAAYFETGFQIQTIVTEEYEGLVIPKSYSMYKPQPSADAQL